MFWWSWRVADVENASEKLILSAACARVSTIDIDRGHQAPAPPCFRTVQTLMRDCVQLQGQAQGGPKPAKNGTSNVVSAYSILAMSLLPPQRASRATGWSSFFLQSPVGLNRVPSARSDISLPVPQKVPPRARRLAHDESNPLARTRAQLGLVYCPCWMSSPRRTNPSRRPASSIRAASRSRSSLACSCTRARLCVFCVTSLPSSGPRLALA